MIQEKGAVTPQETDPDMPWVSRNLQQRRGSTVACFGGLLHWPALGSEALSVAMRAWDLLKEVTIIFITSTIIWFQVNNREGTQLHSSTENWIKDLLKMAPHIRTRPSFPLSQSLSSVQFSSATQSCPALCNPMNCSTPGLPVHHQLQEFTQTHVHRVGDAIQPSHPLSSPSPPASNPSQHQSLFQWVNSLHEVAKVLEFQL